MGIRPEHICVTGRSKADATTKGKVYFLELLRSETIIHLETGFGVLVTKEPGDLKLEENRELEVSFNLDRIHLFYKDTGDTLRA
ncbi:MAG: TOBE domain-containing protein, partial [Spirochaetia bacterium]